MKYFLSLIIFLFLGLASTVCLADSCVFSGSDIKSEFKNCNPATGIQSKSNVDLSVQKSGSDFRKMTASIVKRIQIITSIIAIGIIVWIGLIMVLPVSAEAKESAKSKIFSVLLGFLIMLAATIIVNAIINILYAVLK